MRDQFRREGKMVIEPMSEYMRQALEILSDVHPPAISAPEVVHDSCGNVFADITCQTLQRMVSIMCPASRQHIGGGSSNMDRAPEVVQEQDDPLGAKLHDTMDAQVWAREYVRLNPDADEGNMIGWFANAIMCGHDHASWRKAGELAALQAENDRLRRMLNREQEPVVSPKPAARWMPML